MGEGLTLPESIHGAGRVPKQLPAPRRPTVGGAGIAAGCVGGAGIAAGCANVMGGAAPQRANVTFADGEQQQW